MRVKKITLLPLLLLLLFAVQSQAANKEASIDFLWEANTYTPVWYKGKALPAIQSEIKIAAIPAVPSANLIYEWYVNFEKNIGGSGKNKNSFIFKIDSYEDVVVTAKISNEEKTISKEESIIFNAAKINPQIIFYEDNPLYGEIFSKTLGQSFDLNNETLNIKAEPYFFSKLNNLSYKWEMNDKEIKSISGGRIINVKRPADKSGSALLNLTIQNSLNVLQFAEKKLNINF